jgi:tetratricopeptide (TPR) repeat protein
MSIWLNTTFWIPAYLIAALFIGTMLGEIAAFPRRRIVRGFAAISLIAAAGAAPLIAHFDRNNKSDDYFASDYARNILGTIAPGGVYFGDSDLALFPVLYYQIVEGARPDVLVANPYGYPPSQVFANMPESVRKGFARRPTEADEQIIFEWLIMNSGRPVYSTVKRRWPNVANDGLLYRYAPPGAPIASDDPWQYYVWHTLDPKDVKGDWSAEIVLHEAYFAQSRSLLDQGRTNLATEALDEAALLAAENKDGLNNLGATAAHYGLVEEAARYLKGSLELDPAFVPALKNLARVLIRMNQPAQALTLLDHALALAPGDPQIERIRSACVVAMGKQNAPRREPAQPERAAASGPP